jgi:hypothetical protein
MELVVYNEWQKKGYPMGPSFAACDAGLNRRRGRRCSARVEDKKRKAFSGSYAQFAHPRYGAEECSWGEGKEKTFLTVFNFDNKVFGSPSGCPQEAEELFVATERNAKLRYEGYKKLSEM